MRNLFLTLMIFFWACTMNMIAGDLEIGFEAGLATPSEKVNEIYNKSELTWNKDSLVNLINKGIDAGYHLGINFQMPLNEYFSFSGHLGYNSFPESKIEVEDPNTGEHLATLYSRTSIVPISAGLNFYPLNALINPYATGELSYNYINSSVSSSQNIPISRTPTDSRFGFGFGLGVDFNLELLNVFVEGKYNFINLIGKELSEPEKSYFTLVVGVTF